jgi:hypothetical protein
MERQHVKESTLDYGGGYGREAHAATAMQDEQKGGIAREPEPPVEHRESREGEQQREAQAGRQQDACCAVERALASAREQREQREAQGGSRDAVEQAPERSREQREAQGDSRQDATEQALAHSHERREAGQQARTAGREMAAGNDRSDRGPSREPIRDGQEDGRYDHLRSHGQLSERQQGKEGAAGYDREAPAVTANQVEREGEILQEPERSGEPHQSPEGGQQQEAQAERQQDAVEQALVRSREQREAGPQAEPAGSAVADKVRPGLSGELDGQEAGQANAEPMENEQERDSGPEMGD